MTRDDYFRMQDAIASMQFSAIEQGLRNVEMDLRTIGFALRRGFIPRPLEEWIYNCDEIFHESYKAEIYIWHWERKFLHK